MRLHTASEVISLLRKLETESAAFYEGLAAQHHRADTLGSLAAENRRNIVMVERAYYGVISDALEGGFAFDIDAGAYELPQELTAGVDFSDVLKAAVQIERRMIHLYTLAAEQSGSLLADVPRVLRQVAQKRRARIERLDALMKSQA